MTTPLTHKGRPVPYITPWSREKVTQPAPVATLHGIAYPGPTAGSRGGYDDVLWQYWGSHPGAGEPLWSEVHGPRQRHAMRKVLCQVCGGPADRDERGWLWLLEDERDSGPTWPDGEMTTHPPVCRLCAPLAARLCPHLRRKGAVAVRVAEVIVDAVYGHRYHHGPFGLYAGKADVFLTSSWSIRWVVGNQLVASLAQCTVLDPVETGIKTPVSRAQIRR
ncbi:hypothetical protein ACFV5G_10250 [Streptomyces sp. NPDC059766]|uniref:hypothetical protein n=1 Tax=Streptomyces sp. NPDC059766 TaxID=3346940 RepID=UPI0036535550